MRPPQGAVGASSAARSWLGPADDTETPMSAARVRAALRRGDRVFGTFFQYTTDPAVVEVLPDEGLDFVIVNAEHNALDLADFLPVRWALKSKGIACLARVHGRDPDDVAKACDTFDGVVVPYVEDVGELRRCIAAAKYRPLKGKALDRLVASGEWPSEKTRAYVETKCADTLFVGMIESVRALENLDAICALPGLDAAFVGPNDLTVSMGIPEERDHPDFLAALRRLIATAERHGVAAGAHFSRLEHSQRLISMGARFIPYGSDLRMIQQGTAAFLAALRGAATGAAEGPVI